MSKKKNIKEIAKNLSKKEIGALKEIFNFSKKREFRLGLNEDYISERYQEGIKPLFDRKKSLIYYKSKYGNKYWLPTKKGRKVYQEIKE